MNFIFKQNDAGNHEVIEIDSYLLENGILKVLRTVAAFDRWDEAMAYTKALNAAAEKETT